MPSARTPLVEAPWDDARDAAYSAAVHALPVEEVPLTETVGRVLATDLAARTPLPPFDSSAMDGYAVAGPGPWRLVGEVLAGDATERPLEPGECVRTATGAALPPGTHGVLPWEGATVQHGAGDRGADSTGAGAFDSTVEGTVAPGQFVRPAGEEAAEDEVLLVGGTVLGPAQIGLAASAGADTLAVRRRPRATVLVFGDELLDSGPSRVGRVRDSLGPQLPGWLHRLGASTAQVLRGPDTLEAHVAAISAAVTDLIVTTGGTAAGPLDQLHRALEVLEADVLVDSVAVRPGHPMVLARVRDRHVLGLPGNPQSAIVALLSLGVPLMAGLQGRSRPQLVDCVLAEDVRAPERETRLVLSVLDRGRARPVRHLGSGMLRGLAAAGGFAVVRPGGQSAGEHARWLQLP